MCTQCKSMGHKDKFCNAPKEWKPKEPSIVPKASEATTSAESASVPTVSSVPTVPSDGDTEGTKVPTSSAPESASLCNDANTEGDDVRKSGPENVSATKPQVPDDGSTEG